MTKKYLLGFMVSFAVSLLFCVVLIPLLRRFKAGQNILHYVKEHKRKSGTPTMGGIAFVFASVATTICFVGKINKTLIICFSIGLAYMSVGLLDDFLKMKHKQNLGLKAWQKFFFQACIALFSGIYCLRAGLTDLHIPFLNETLRLGFWVLPLSVFVFIGAVNAVNLTDGLDGLAAGVSVPCFLTLSVLMAIQNANEGLTVLGFNIVGSLLAYLLFNVFPARIFMGDTGSLALGGFAASICVFSGNALYLSIVGACFIFSVISVIIQVIYYKATKGKRVFMMAPIHHHFQMKGYSETQIAYAYSTITLFLGVLIIITVL